VQAAFAGQRVDLTDQIFHGRQRIGH
jgi:hypothetical protein